MRLNIVNEWLKQPSRKRTPQWRAEFLSNVKQKTKNNITQRTIYRWIKEFENNGIEGLVPKYSNRGRKTPFDKKALELLNQAKKI